MARQAFSLGYDRYKRVESCMCSSRRFCYFKIEGFGTPIIASPKFAVKFLGDAEK